MQDGFSVDPTGLAPASLDVKAKMLLYTPRAQVHVLIVKLKKLL